MSTTGNTAGARRAAEAIEPGGLSSDPYGRVGAVEANKRHFLPRHADGWSILLAVVFMIGVPLWFFAAHKWNPNYVPIQPWVWSVPWILANIYWTIQMLCLLTSAVDSEKIGVADIGVSLVALVVVIMTFTIVVVLWNEGKYNLGGFQWNELVAFTVAAASELVCTTWVRMLVNRRSFVSNQN